MVIHGNTFLTPCMEAESHSTASHPEPFLDGTEYWKWGRETDSEDKGMSHVESTI